MIEDNVNAQEAPENSALENSGNNEASVEASQAPVEDNVAVTPVEESPKTYTQKELDDQSAKIRAIAQRKANREAETRIQAEREQIQQQSSAQPVANNQAVQQPSVDHVWDNLLGWVHKDTSDAQKLAMVTNALMEQGQQPQNVSQSGSQIPQQAAPQVSAEGMALQNKAIDQLDECVVEYGSDFEMVAKACFTAEMVLAASMVPDGIQNLYKEAQENPKEFFKMSKLSADEQKFKVWEMQKKRSNAPVKVVTSATPQPDPLQTSGSLDNGGEVTFNKLKADFIKNMK